MLYSDAELGLTAHATQNWLNTTKHVAHNITLINAHIAERMIGRIKNPINHANRGTQST